MPELKLKKNSSFTLLEITIVISIILILFAIIIITINPTFQIQQARNDQRKAHIMALYGAFIEYKSRNGDFPECVSVEATDISNCQDLVPDYISSLPEDPLDGCEFKNTTGYYVKKGSVLGIGIKAMCAELDTEITAGNWEEE